MRNQRDLNHPSLLAKVPWRSISKKSQTLMRFQHRPRWRGFFCHASQVTATPSADCWKATHRKLKREPITSGSFFPFFDNFIKVISCYWWQDDLHQKSTEEDYFLDMVQKSFLDMIMACRAVFLSSRLKTRSFRITFKRLPNSWRVRFLKFMQCSWQASHEAD